MRSWSARAALFLGIVWSSPITLPAFVLYVLPLWVLGLYTFRGWDEVAWVWTFDAGVGRSLLRRLLDARWRGWAGHACGNIIVMKTRDASHEGMTLRHEKAHVRQAMVMGPMFIIVYLAFYATCRFLLRDADGYYDNPMEIDARRAAGQVIDVVGVVNKLSRRV